VIQVILRLFGVVVTEHDQVQLAVGLLVLEQGAVVQTVQRPTPAERELEQARVWWASVAGPMETQ
jgi:hypothetical protein